MRLAKRCIDRGVELGPRGALATELLAIEENLAASDWRTGMAASVRSNEGVATTGRKGSDRAR